MFYYKKLKNAARAQSINSIKKIDIATNVNKQISSKSGERFSAIGIHPVLPLESPSAEFMPYLRRNCKVNLVGKKIPRRDDRWTLISTFCPKR